MTMPTQKTHQNMTSGCTGVNARATPRSMSAAPSVEIDPEHLKDAITVFQEAFELHRERLYRVASKR